MSLLTIYLHSNKNPKHGIFSLNLLFTKVYLVSSTEIIRLMQRNQKTLTFDPVNRFSIQIFSGIDNERTLRIVSNAHEGGLGLGAEMMHSMAPNLVGDALDRMILITMQNVKRYFDELQDTPSLDLYRWIRNMITVSSTRATYGPLNNPYNDPEVVNGFWYVPR